MNCSTPGCPSPTPGAYSNSCPSRQWCHQTISSSVIPFSSCLQSFPASESFPMSQFSAWGGQSIGVSASASVLPMNIQDWLLLGMPGWISLQSKGISGVFSNTTVQKINRIEINYIYTWNSVQQVILMNSISIITINLKIQHWVKKLQNNS